MAQDLSKLALGARRAVMELCQAVEAGELKKAAHGPPMADQLAVRDQLINDLVEILGAILEAAGADSGDTELAEAVAKGRHVLDNVRDALPKAGE